MNNVERITRIVKLVKTAMLRSSLCDYSDAYILVKGTITIANRRTASEPNNADKKVMFKYCASLLAA